MSTLIRYTLLRLLIFAVCFGVLWMLFGTTMVSNWLLALLALLFTSGLSMLLLRRQGTETAEALGVLVARSRGRFERSVDASASKEDSDPASAEADADAGASAEGSGSPEETAGAEEAAEGAPAQGSADAAERTSAHQGQHGR